jgi:hypothetical protein
MSIPEGEDAMQVEQVEQVGGSMLFGAGEERALSSSNRYRGSVTIGGGAMYHPQGSQEGENKEAGGVNEGVGFGNASRKANASGKPSSSSSSSSSLSGGAAPSAQYTQHTDPASGKKYNVNNRTSSTHWDGERGREAELSETEFESTFGMTKEAFYGLATWKQTKLKKEHDLF